MQIFKSVAIICLFVFGSISGAQITPKPDEKKVQDVSDDNKPECAEVIFNRQVLFCFEQGVGAYSAKERARAVESRIQNLSEDVTVPVEEIAMVETNGHYEIKARNAVLVSLTEADVENRIDVSPREYAIQKAEEIKKQIKIDRDKRSPRQVAIGGLYSLLSLTGLILALVILNKLITRLDNISIQKSAIFARFMKFQSYELVTESRILEVLHGASKVLQVFVSIMLVYFFIPLTLSFFPWTANFASTIWDYVLRPVNLIANHLIDYLPKLVFVIVACVLTYYLLKVIRFVFLEIERGSIRIQGFYQEWAMPTYQLTRFIVLALLLIVVFPYLPGSSSPAFQGVTVFLGILLSFGSSSAIANVIAGVVLTYMRPFRIGDRVKIADTTGDVIEKNLLVTRIRTIKNVDITVPNSMVLGSHIINYSSSAKTKGLILNPVVTIGYEVPWENVHEALKEAALRTPYIMKKPEPFVFQAAFNNFNVSYELNAYTEESLKMAEIYSLLNENIQTVFHEKKIQIVSPEYHILQSKEGSDLRV